MSAMISREKAIDAALNGVDYLVKNQIKDRTDANCGRYLCQYDYIQNKVLAYTTNWTTGVCIECMLIAHKLTSSQRYLDSARLAAEYIASLQYFSSTNKKMEGVFREETPQTMMAHPRDALTAAWALLDFSQYTGQKAYLDRSILYAEWFISVAMEKGYPYWTVRMDNAHWEPNLFGSFQSGGAFYFLRLFDITGNSKYKVAGLKILDHYNKYHLVGDGRIHVCVDMKTLKPVVGYEVAPKSSIKGWEVMHEYNDDYGALANLAAWKLTGDSKYLASSECFLKRMLSIQHQEGGFGPAGYCVTSAGGSVLIELTAAAAIGCNFASVEQLSKIAEYILGLQVKEGLACGGFCGVDNNTYLVSGCTNARETTYSIMGLMRYAGIVDDFYFFDMRKKADTFGCSQKICSVAKQQNGNANVSIITPKGANG